MFIISNSGHILAPVIVFMWGLFLKRSEVPIFAPGHSTAPFHTNPFPLDPYLLPTALPFVLAFASWFLSSLFTFSLYPFPPDFSLPILSVYMTSIFESHTLSFISQCFRIYHFNGLPTFLFIVIIFPLF